MFDGRGANPDMNLFSPGFPQYPNNMGHRGAADDAVVHHYQPLPLNYFGQRVQLLADAQVAQPLFRLNKGAAYIAVLNQPIAVGNARLPGVAHGRRRRGVRNTHYQIGDNGMFPGQLRPHFPAGCIDQHPIQHAVRAGKVDMLENAHRPPLGGAVIDGGTEAVAVNDHRLSGLDVPRIFRAQMIQGAAFRGDNPALLQSAQAQGPDAERIPGRQQGILGQGHYGKGPGQGTHTMEQPLLPGGAGGVNQLVGNHFGIGGGGKAAGPLFLQLPLQLGGVDDVAVVGQGQPPGPALDQQGLGVAKLAGAGGGVAGMADGKLAIQGQKVPFPENLGNEAHIHMDVNIPAIGGGDAGAFLPPVLEGQDAKESDPAGGGSGQINAHYTARFPWVVKRPSELGAGQFIVHVTILSRRALAVNAFPGRVPGLWAIHPSTSSG